MRILQLAPIWETVPPPAYGGTESVVSILVEELASRGHDVTLCASGESKTSAKLHSVYHRSLRTASDLENAAPYDWMHVALALKGARDYDIVHNHAGELAMAMGHLVETPMLTTMHCWVTSDAAFVWRHYKGWFNNISHAQRAASSHVSAAKSAGVVHNAIDVKSFPYSEQKDGYLLFLSRISPEKGAHIAIEVARRVDMPLVIAGKMDAKDRPYFEEVLRPYIDGRNVTFVGEADAVLKRDLYAKARCLLLPLCWEEPFGLVMAEAMACGTPVVTFARGAAPEVVSHGRTGYIVSDVDGMVEAVRVVDRIRPADCRHHVEDRFSPATMASRYLAIYDRMLAERDGRVERAPASRMIAARAPIAAALNATGSLAPGL